MPIIEGPAGPVELDDRGYLKNTGDWSRELAPLLAARDGLRALTADHWSVIDVLRAHHREHGTTPMIRELCRQTGFTLKRLYELFPKGPAQDACRVAGLPRPDSCV
jgi:TusE/DsrC/DsvC family sulfur relay protein